VKLRFEVDQAACLRAGIDCPKSIVTVEVDPAKLTQEERDIIADRLVGIDVASLHNSGDGTIKEMSQGKPVRIIAKAPTFQGLLIAIRENAKETAERMKRHRVVALEVANAGIDVVEMFESAQSGQSKK
jgi:hypothetical protein